MTKTPFLKKGSHGKDVEDLQRLLIENGYGHLLGKSQVDGDFGKCTHSAVVAFQRDRKMAARGIVGEYTLNELQTAKEEKLLAKEKMREAEKPGKPSQEKPHESKEDDVISSKLSQKDREAVEKIQSTNADPTVHSNRKPLIVLDPGHGKFICTTGKKKGEVVNDVGCMAAGVTEAKLNLKIAKALGKELEERGFRVKLTRKSDDHVLPSRFKARIETGKGEKELHLSIHVDALKDPTKKLGINMFKHPTLDDDSPSALFAKALDTPGTKLGVSDRMAMLSPRLMGNVPAALVELGNMKNKQERNYLNSSEGQQEIADMLADRITLHYNATHPPKSTRKNRTPSH